jgi:hypothetical protein
MLWSIFFGEISAAWGYVLQHPPPFFARIYNNGLQQYDGIRGFAKTVHFEGFVLQKNSIIWLKLSIYVLGTSCKFAN